MPSIEHWIERLLPCPCTALASIPFPCCLECGGDGESWQEILVDVEYAYQRASRGSRDSYGVPLEPDEPESVEIQSVTGASGREVELTPAELDQVEKKCLEDASERACDFAED